MSGRKGQSESEMIFRFFCLVVPKKDEAKKDVSSSFRTSLLVGGRQKLHHPRHFFVFRAAATRPVVGFFTAPPDRALWSLGCTQIMESTNLKCMRKSYKLDFDSANNKFINMFNCANKLKCFNLMNRPSLITFQTAIVFSPN